MRAIILSGGYGSRLRPLTLTRPKSIIELCNVPIIEFQIAQFSMIGVTDVIVALNYKADDLIPSLKDMEMRYGIKIHISIEDKPLGTAGPIKLAENFLKKNEPFFVCNSDIICNFPLEDMLNLYNSNNINEGCAGVILVKQVSDPSKYGVVIHDEETSMVKNFIEKPKEFVGNFINAGIYVLSYRILELIKPNQPVSIEKDVFPIMASTNKLFCKRFYMSNGANIWADIGNPKDYLIGTQLLLEFLNSNSSDNEDIESSYSDKKFQLLRHLLKSNLLKLQTKCNKFNIQGNNVIHSTAIIGEDCEIGPNVVIGKNCRIGSGVRLKNCTIFGNTNIEKFSNISNSIIGQYCNIGKWVYIEGLSVFGDDVNIQDELYVNSSIILPNKNVTSSIQVPNTICL